MSIKKTYPYSKMCNARALLIDRLHTYCRLNADACRLCEKSTSMLCTTKAAAVPAACFLSGERTQAYCLLAADSICRNLKDLLPHSTFSCRCGTFFSRYGTFSCIPPRGSKFRVMMARCQNL